MVIFFLRFGNDILIVVINGGDVIWLFFLEFIKRYFFKYCFNIKYKYLFFVCCDDIFFFFLVARSVYFYVRNVRDCINIEGGY